MPPAMDEVTPEQRQEIIRQYIRDKMRKMGKSRSKKKLAAAMRNVKKAQDKRWGRKRPK